MAQTVTALYFGYTNGNFVQGNYYEIEVKANRSGSLIAKDVYNGTYLTYDTMFEMKLDWRVVRLGG